MISNTRGWLALALTSGLLAACGDSTNNTNNNGTDAGTPTTDMGSTTDGATGDRGTTTDRGATTDRPAARDTGPAPNPCSSPTDLSTMTAGSDGAIHVTGDNNSADPVMVGNLGSCLASGGAKGYSVVYRYTMHAAGVLNVTTNTSMTDFDTVLAVLPTCSTSATPLACNDDVNTMGRVYSSATHTGMLTSGQTVFIVVGGWGQAEDSAAQGNYELVVREQVPVAIGMPCHVGDACATGSVCAGATATNAGVCVADGGAGGNCRTTAPFCDTGSSCSVAAPAAAAPGTCLRAVNPGDACGDSTSCTMGSVCPNFAVTTAGADGGAGGTRSCVAPVSETEPNNTPATAQAAVTHTTTFVAALAAGDVDCFAVTVPAGTSLYAETSDARGTCSLGTGADTILNIYAAGSTTALATNDDIGTGNLCSHLDGRTTTSLTRVAAGTYDVCVSSYVGDAGTATAIAQYYLTVGLIP